MNTNDFKIRYAVCVNTVAPGKRANSVAGRLRVWTGEMVIAAWWPHLRAEVAWSLKIGSFLQHIKRVAQPAPPV
jgi:hypothetical protein